MYSISTAFRQELENDNRIYLIRLEFTFRDGHQLTVNNSGVWQGGLRFEEAVSGDSEFQVGSAIINKLNITLNNISDQYSSYVFEGAKVIAYIGLELSNGTTEMVRRGTYIVDSVTGQNASLIKLECLDYMTKFDVPYSEVNTIYPATLGKIVRDICSECSVTLLTSSFDGSSYVVRTRPNSDGLTCRQVLAYAAQIACMFARMDDRGRLEFRWFRVGENIDPEHSFLSIYNIATSQYNVAITGVRVTEEFRETDTQKKQTELWGAEGYVLDISGNELIQSGTALTVAQMIGQKLVGVLSFKIVDATITSDPSVEAGDTAVIIDEKGNSAFFPITRVVFETDNSMSVSCSAKTPSRQASTVYDQLTRAIIKANNYTSERLSDYDRAVLELSQLMSETFGVFMTEVVQQDGSVIRIQHNKPHLEDSNIQWKMTAGALAVSDDYGQTWNAGIDAQGNAVVNVLNAIGVNADWIRTGRLSVSDGSNVVFQADLDTGSVYLSGDYVYIGDKTATEALSELAGALVITLSNEMQGIPVDSDGHYDTFPNVYTTIRVFYGSEDVTSRVTLTDNALGVTGTLSYNSAAGTYTYHATSLTADTGYVAFTASYVSQVGTITNSKRFNLYKAYAGATGPAGTATLYMLEPNVDIVKRGADDVCTPDRITFSAFHRDGDAATRYPYSGLIEIYVMRTDSSEWELVVPALENKTSETYVITDPKVGNVKAVLKTQANYNDVYWGLTDEVATDPPVVLVDSDDTWFNTDHTIEVISGGETIDISTVPVLTDISNLTQDKVFDILTDGGTLEGLWYLNGKVYFNASYIATGVLRSKNGSTYWDLDSGTMVLSPSAKVGSASGESLIAIQGRITTTATRLQSEIELRTQADETLRSSIEETAGSITLEAQYRKSADDELSGRITVNSDNIELRVTQAQATNIANSAITLRKGEIRLDADTAIAWDAPNSTMDEQGNFSAKNAYLTGTVTANATIVGATLVSQSVADPAQNNGFDVQITGGQIEWWGFPGYNWGRTTVFGQKKIYYDSTNNTVTENSVTGATQVDGAVVRNVYGFSVNVGSLTSNASSYRAFFVSTSEARIHKPLYALGANFSRAVYVGSNLDVHGALTVDGNKKRIVQTDDYGKRGMSAYETPAPMFGDIGDGVIGDDGVSYIQIDPVFSETIDTYNYQVFLQAYGDGKCYVMERKPNYFVVNGEPGLAFGWEIKGKQKDFMNERLDIHSDPVDMEQKADYAAMAAEYMEELYNERTGAETT